MRTKQQHRVSLHIYDSCSQNKASRILSSQTMGPPTRQKSLRDSASNMVSNIKPAHPDTQDLKDMWSGAYKLSNKS